MNAARIVVIGGGPGGLLTGRLLARAGFDVTVRERLDPSATYGFGVALARRALDRLRGVDPAAADVIAATCHPLRRWTMRRGEESASIDDHGAFGVERTGLLRTVQQLAVDAGVHVDAGREARLEQEVAGADAVVLAEGAGSLGRGSLASELGAEVRAIPFPYIWCGAALDLDAMTLEVRRTEHGILNAHAMPYGDGRSTFQVDTVPDTLRSAGLGAEEPPGNDSDEPSLRYLSQAFSRLLDGRTLAGNRSRWSHFRLVTCDRWSAGKVVLLGDAAHTAHYTVGSGTRMAMEDAIVLSQALAGESSLDAAFASYERERRPAVEHLQWRATRSQLWWRTLAHRYDLPLPVLLLSYFTRTGSVDLGALAASNGAIVRAAIEHRRHTPALLPARGTVEAGPHLRLGDEAAQELLAARAVRREQLGASVAEIPCDGVAPWSSRSEALAGELADRSSSGFDAFLLTGGGDRRDALDRFDIAEELKAATSLPVAVAVPDGAIADAATAVAAGRTDLVVLGERS